MQPQWQSADFPLYYWPWPVRRFPYSGRCREFAALNASRSRNTGTAGVCQSHIDGSPEWGTAL